MTRQLRYPIGRDFNALCESFQIDPRRVIGRANVAPDALDINGRGVTGVEYFSLWAAFSAELKRPDAQMFLAKAMARAPFKAPMFAFSCSPDIATGISRLSMFKPLIGPCRIMLSQAPHSFDIALHTVEDAIAMPADFALFDVIYLVEIFRNFTAEHIVPLEVRLPADATSGASLHDYFGVTPKEASVPGLTLRKEDASLPLISQNPDVWPELERNLMRKLAEQTSEAPMTIRAKQVLLEMLPSGEATIEEMCARLHMSKRSLQRYLKREGQSFRSILTETRSELAQSYLARGELSIEEISYLLAYREPNSFYRAVSSWTGMTPSQVARRANLNQA